MTTRPVRTLVALALLTLAALPANLRAQQTPLTQLRLDIVGLRLKIDPAELTVPKNIPTQIDTILDLPPGAAPEAINARATLQAQSTVEAELRGPGIQPQRLTAKPGQPILLPAFVLAGEYFLENIRLVKDGQVVLAGTPDRVPIHVIDQVFITSVTTRPLSLDEIRSKGIVIDEKNFQVLNFELALNLASGNVKIKLPVAIPSATQTFLGKNIPGLQVQLAQLNAQLGELVQIPPELQRPGLNFSIASVPFYPVKIDEDEDSKRFGPPPITGLVLIPGNVAYLNQFFSAQVVVMNVAPNATPLILRDVQASIVLPTGPDRAAGTYDTPGDDPLRLARIQGIGLQPVVPVLHVGQDGQKVAEIRAQEKGEGEFLIEGLREGIHSMDIGIEAVLEGLPSGPVRLSGTSGGVVLVRNPRFSIALSHPRTVRAGESYELFATLTNTSQTPGNLVGISLFPRAITGAELISEPSVSFPTVAPGDSVTASFKLIARKTGTVDFSYLDTDANLAGRFELRTGIGERNIPLSGATIVLPKTVSFLPASLVAAAQRVLGQAFSISTAPAGGLPANVQFVNPGAVVARGIELAEAGQRIEFGQSLEQVVQELLFDWSGSRYQDAGFDQLLRTTGAGAGFFAEVGKILGPAVTASGGILNYQRTLAESNAYRAGFISVIAGSSGTASPVTLSIEDPNGSKAGPGQSSLPYGYPLALLNPPTSSPTLVTTNLAASVYIVEARGTSSGPFDLGVVLPGGTGSVRHLRFAGVAMQTGGLARLVLDLSSFAYSLEVDADGNGTFEALLNADITQIFEQPPHVIGIKQISELTGKPEDPAAHGMAVGVLFSKPMDDVSVSRAASYSVENNEVLAAKLQPSGRLSYVILRKGIGAHIPRRMVVRDVSDEHGQVMGSQEHPINAVLTAGGQVAGRVRLADGTAVGNIPITLKVLICDDGCYYVPISQFRNRDDGSYDIDFVSRSVSSFIVEALDLATNEIAARTASIRGDGERVLLDLVFIGKGGVRGRVLAADGVTPVPGAAVFLNPAPTLSVSDSQRTEQGMNANEAGEFLFADVPVGNFVLNGFGPTGFTGLAAGVVNSAGDRVTVDLVLSVSPERLGRLTGRVFQSDGATPLVNATIYVGNRTPAGFYAIGIGTTDTSGSFTFERLQETGDTPYEVVAVDPATGRIGSASVHVMAAKTAFAVIVLEATGAVEGVVRNAQGQLVAGALVAGGLTLGTTDANGFFRIEGVPAGLRGIEAGDPVTKRRGSASVTVLPGQTVRAEITLEARATIVGRVLDANGQPVPRATVRIPVGSGFFFVFANNAGFYRFPDMELRDYLIQAPGPSQESLIQFMKDHGIDPIRAFTSGDAPPEIANAKPPETPDEILNAYREAVNTYIGATNRLLTGLPPIPSGGFGWTKVRLLQDSVTVSADVKYLAQGTASGRTVNSAGVPTGALTRLMALAVNKYGFPVFEEVARMNSDAQTGAFSYEGIPRFDLTTFQIAGVRSGDFTIEAASPFSPVVARYSSALNTSNLNEQDIELRFPALSETNGTVGGQVFLPDGTTPAGANVQVTVSFGDLTLTTDATGRFNSTFPIPGGRAYRVIAFDPATGFSGQTEAYVPAGGHVDVAIRLVGWGSVLITAKRADGSLVVGGKVTLSAGGHPGGVFEGTTNAQGQIRFVNIPEGGAGIHLEELGTGLTGRSSVTIVRDAEAQAVVIVAPSGRVRGIFLKLDGQTPIATAQVELTTGNLRVQGSTDQTGRFELFSIPVGQFSVVAFDPLTGRLGRASGEVIAEGAIATVTLIETARGRVEGVVLQADGATRVGGATVTLSLLDISSAVPLQASAFTDGSFSFDGVSAGRFSLVGVDPITRFSGTADGVITAEGEVVRREILLEPFGSVRVTVLDHTGAAVSNARVTLRAGPLARQGPVDGAGTITFDALKLDTYSVTAVSLAAGREHDGGIASVKLKSAGEVVDVTVRLRGIGNVAVKVVGPDGLTPIVGARVSLTASAASAGETPGPFEGSFLAFTGVDGTTGIEGVPVGTFFVRAEADLVSGLSTGAITTPDTETLITVQLAPSASIRGRVLLAGGVIPAAQAYVTLNFQPQNSLQSGAIQVTTGLDGRFEFDGIPLGPFSLGVLEPVTKGVRTRTGSLTSPGQLLDLGDLILDNESPFVESVTPAKGLISVSRMAGVVLRFNEPMKPASFIAAGDPGTRNIGILRGQTFVPVTMSFSTDLRTVTLMPLTPPLESSGLYSVVVRGVPEGPQDLEGLKPVEPFVSSFVVEDYIPPAIISASPTFGARAVTLDAPVRITFSETVSPSFNISLTSNTGASIPGNSELILGGTVLTFVPSVFLAPNASYTFTLSGVRDLAGNLLSAGPVSIGFATLRTTPPAITALQLLGTPSRIGGSSVTVLPQINDDEVVRVEYLVGDGSHIAGTSPFSRVVSLPATASSIDVTAVAVDSSGNRSQPVTLSIPIVANQAPTALIARTDSGSTLFRGRTARFRVDATDDLFLTSVTISSVGAFSVNQTFDVPADSATFTREFDVNVPEVDGSVRLQAVALDSVGNVSSASELIYEVVEVTKTTPVVTWPAPAAITYGTALGSSQLNASTTVAGTFVYDPPAGTYLEAGDGQTLAVTFTPADTGLYEPSSANVAIDVRRAILSVVAESKTKAFGSPLPELTYTLSGFVRGETAAVITGAPVLTTSATANSAIGEYPIEPAQGTLSAVNYAFDFVNGTLTITAPTDTPVVGGFSAARASGFAVADGAELSAFRADLATLLPSATLTSATTLTDSFLASLDLALLASPTGNTTSVAPLSAAEQRALRTFVLNGGGAVLLVDNDSFSEGAAAANDSLLATFGVHVTGTAPPVAPATVPDPLSSPVTNGPFGTVSALSLNYPGWIDVLGPATPLGTLDGNGMPFLAVIPKGALGAGSGAVVIVSDAGLSNQWWSPAYRTLVLNAISYARAVPLEDFEDLSLDGWTQSGDAWSVGGTTGTVPNVLPLDGRAFARSGAPNGLSGPLAESNTGSVTSPLYQVTHDELRWLAAGWSGQSFDGQSFFEILDAQGAVKAQIPAPQSDSWVPLTINLLTAGFSIGDSFSFRAVDGQSAGNYAWLAFDKLMLRRTVPPKTSPVITWPTPADIVYGTPLSETQLNATADVPGTFAYTPAAGTVLGAGNARELKVEFTPEDTDHYEVVTKSVFINVAKAPQPALAITGAPASAIFGSSFALGTTGGAGTGGVTFAVTGVCTVSGNVVTMASGVGTCQITATKAEDANYLSVTSPAVSVAAARAPQAAFSVTDAPETALNGSTFTVGFAGGSGTGAVTFSATGACTNTSGEAEIRMTSPTGTCTVVATKAADDNYAAATSVPVLVAAGGDVPPVFDIVESSAFAAFCAPGDALCPPGGSSLPAQVGLRLRSNEVSVRIPATGIAVTLLSSNPQCATVSASTTLAGGTFGAQVSASYGGTDPLPCSATITAETLNYGSDSVTVTVYRFTQSPIVVAPSSVSYFNPAPPVSANGDLTTNVAAVSYFNPAPIPTSAGTLVTRAGAVSYYNPATLPAPDGVVKTGAAAVSYYNPAAVPNPDGDLVVSAAAVSYLNQDSLDSGLQLSGLQSANGAGDSGAGVSVAATSISVANGPTATALSPIQLSRSAASLTRLTIEGANLTGATAVKFIGLENDISSGVPFVSADGRTLTLDVYVQPGAPLGVASVVVTGPGWSTLEVPAMQVEIVP